MLCKVELFDQAKSFSRSSNPPDIGKFPVQNGLAHERLQWVVIHQENYRHTPAPCVLLPGSTEGSPNHVRTGQL